MIWFHPIYLVQQTNFLCIACLENTPVVANLHKKKSKEKKSEHLLLFVITSQSAFAYIYIYIFICCVLCSRINLSCKSRNAEHFTAASYRCKCATKENSPPDGMEGVSTKKKGWEGGKCNLKYGPLFFFFFFSRRAPDEGRWRFKYNHVRQDTGKSQLSPNYTKEKKEKKSVSARHRDADLQAQSPRKHTLALRLIELKATAFKKEHIVHLADFKHHRIPRLLLFKSSWCICN